MKLKVSVKTYIKTWQTVIQTFQGLTVKELL